MLRRAPSVGAANRWWRGEAGASCTESLGSDSGDVGCDAAEIDRFFPPAGGPDANADDADAGADSAALCGVKEAAPSEKRRRGGGGFGFPPAMPRATGALFLRAERRGGRLILTEVRADERERRVVFRAERDGGRLRLRFANDADADPDGGAGGPQEAGAGGGGAGGVVDVAVQHGGGGGGGGGKLCQVAAGAVVAGRRGVVEVVGAVLMGTTI